MDTAKLVAKLAKWCITSHLGFPHINADYVRRFIERPETEASELQEYKATTRTARGARTAFRISGLSFACCALVVVLVRVQELNFKDPHRNLVPLVVSPDLNDNSTTPKHRFNCLATNCTARLKAGHDESGSLASDLLELPLFSMCHPTLSFFQENTQLYGPVGILLAALVGLVVVCVLAGGLAFPLFQGSNRAPNSYLMFLVAPKVTRRVVYDRARELYDEIKRSGLNCELNHQIRRIQEAPLSSPQTVLHPGPNCAYFRCTSHSSLAQQSLNSVYVPTNSKTNDDKYAHEFANDCVSIMRSDWWHCRVLRAYYLVLRQTTINIVFLWSLYYFILFAQLRKSQARLTQAGQQADVNNCTIWIEDESCTMLYDGSNLPGYRRLDLAAYELQIHPLGMLLFTTQYTWAIVPANILMITYLFVTAELFTWLYEIKFQLRLANEYLRQLNGHAGGERKRLTVQSFQLEPLRHLYASLANVPYLSFLENYKFGRLEGSRMRRTNSRFESSVAIETFVAQSIQQQRLQPSAALELLEKLHVNFRLFIEHVRHYGPTMTMFFCLFATGYTYCMAIIIIYYIRRIDNHDPFPFVLMVASWAFVNALLWFTSSFHAKAKELHSLIWSLVAELTSNAPHDARSRHLHSLWFKQVLALDQEHGLALKAFNLSITYIRMIQLVIGSGTLMTFALR